MPLPKLTPEQQEQALRKAREARKARAGVRAGLKRGELTLAGVLAKAPADDAVGKMRVSAALESLPGMGKARARQAMERIGIAEGRRLRGLGASQRAALLQEFGGTLA